MNRPESQKLCPECGQANSFGNHAHDCMTGTKHPETQAEILRAELLFLGNARKIIEACDNYARVKAQAEALAAALRELIHFEDEYYLPMPHTGGGVALKDAKAALAAWDKGAGQ